MNRTSGHSFDPEKIRVDFPILATTAHGKPLVYLDNGATTQKPRAVIEAITRYYETQNANVHRGVYQLSQTATELYEGARVKVQKFINAGESAEIIFTRGTTEGINLVAACWSHIGLQAGDEVLVSELEHHSNIVPWQIACDAAKAKLRPIPLNDEGELRMDEFARMIGPRTKMVAVNYVSNSLGTINPIEQIIAAAHKVGAMVLVDAAQWVAHHPSDVRKLDVDFYCFSGHKLFGPTGIGVLYGKRELLDAMPPYMGGGDMIRSVTFEKTEYADLPNKFEAGTPDIAGAVGLGAAIDYLTGIGFAQFMDHEAELLTYATRRLAEVPGLRVIGTAKHKAGVISFVVENPTISPLDLGTYLDREGIAVRTGHHCCQPVMHRFGITATTRASFALYNTKADVDALVAALQKLRASARPAQAAGPATELKYPAASAASPAMAADEIAEVFGMLEDRDARSEYVIELGGKLPGMPQSLKIEPNRVHGCMSTVHLFGQRRADGRLDFVADSDAHIVRGLIGLLEKLFAGQKASEILAFDVQQFFQRIGLEQFISVQRRTGLDGMIKKIRALASDGKVAAHV
jgi:cysteine desulfurase/selenocysteine lyase